MIEQHEPCKNRGVKSDAHECLSSSCSTCDTGHVTLVTIPMVEEIKGPDCVMLESLHPYPFLLIDFIIL